MYYIKSFRGDIFDDIFIIEQKGNRYIYIYICISIYIYREREREIYNLDEGPPYGEDS